MVHYYQFLPETEIDEDGIKINEVTRHIIEHLASVVSEDDDPRNAPSFKVDIHLEESIRESDGAKGLLIKGFVDAEPVAPYLHPDFDPEDDVKNNPLSVKSILDEEDRDERSEST